MDARIDDKILAKYGADYYLANYSGPGDQPNSVYLLFEHEDGGRMFGLTVPISKVFKLPALPDSCAKGSKAAKLDLAALVSVQQESGDYSAAQKPRSIDDRKTKRWEVHCFHSNKVLTVSQGALQVVCEGSSAKRDCFNRNIWPEQDLAAKYAGVARDHADGADKLIKWSPDGAHHKATILDIADISYYQSAFNMYYIKFYGRNGELLQKRFQAHVSEIEELLDLPPSPTTEESRKERDADPKSFAVDVYVLTKDIKDGNNYLPAIIVEVATAEELPYWKAKFVFGDKCEALFGLNELRLLYAGDATKLDRDGTPFHPTDNEHTAFVKDSIALGEDLPKLPAPFTEHICTDISTTVFCKNKDDEDETILVAAAGWRDITQLKEIRNNSGKNPIVNVQRKNADASYTNGMLDGSSVEAGILVEFKSMDGSTMTTIYLRDVSKV